jgi:hypothetical protein
VQATVVALAAGSALCPSLHLQSLTVLTHDIFLVQMRLLAGVVEALEAAVDGAFVPFPVRACRLQ